MGALVITTGGFAHAVHYGVLALGLAGVVALLVPGRRGGASGPTSPGVEGGDAWVEHRARLDRLRAELEGRDLRAARRGRPTPSVRLAVGASLVAAVVHAVVCPEHVAEGLLLGAFFAACALTQLFWAGLALRRPDPSVLAAGLVLNVALVALWAVTRTLGLPLGLLPGPEEVGGWDLTAVLTELLVVAGCAAALRTASVHRPAARRIAEARA